MRRNLRQQVGGRIVEAVCVGMLSTASAATAQDLYDLVVPGGATSRAERTDGTLRIEDSEGKVTVYQRNRRYDTADGQYLGYSSTAARQIVRWPAEGRGRMQLATDAPPIPVAFRTSQMEVVPRTARVRPPAAGAPPPGGGGAGVTDPDPQVAYRLVAATPGAPGGTLGVDRDRILTLRSSVPEESRSWHLTALAPGLVRLHNDAWGREWSLAGNPEDSPRLVRTSESLDQLWRLVPLPGTTGEVAFTNVGVRGCVLAFHGAGGVAVKPWGWGGGYGWRIEKIGVFVPPSFAGYRLAMREIRPHAALPPAQVELRNLHSKELWVLLTDRLQGGDGQRIKLPPGMAVTTMLERDAGATLVEIYERGLASGVVRREEWTTELPPAPRYDASVYEVIVQSVAIDRTVPGGKLEDVQYAPRSLGWFEFAAGDQLQDGPVDVYAVALAQQNPGQVRRIDPTAWRPRSAAVDPVESLLEKFQRKPPR